MKTKAFTLIEMLVAMAVIALIAGFVFVSMNGAANAKNDMKRKADIEVIKNAVIQYRSEHYSTGPVQATYCGIGTDCTNLDSALQPFLGSAPKDPDGTSYIYQSINGTDCAILAILSDGSAYKYDCQTDLLSLETVINGDCGLSSAYELDEETSGLCEAGAVNSFSGTGPWNWSCLGENGGSNASCVASVTISDLACSVVSGACGGATILKLDSGTGHAELPGQSNYSSKVCCTGTGISNSCSASPAAVALKLSSETDAHVEKNTFSNYSSSNDACLSATTPHVSCDYADDCSSLGAGYVCLASISSNTNAHVGDCSAYSTKVCCKAY